MSSPPHPPETHPLVEELRGWLPEWMELTLAQKCEDSRWFVLIEEFDITGMGETLEDARWDALHLLGAYLHDHFHDGTPFEQTLRPIPRRLKLEIRAGTKIHQIARRVGPRGAKEYKMLVPPSALNGAAVAA